MLQVRRQAGDAIHFVTSPLPVGEDVKQSVEWTRRFDHMQQHSGTVQATLFLLCKVLYIILVQGSIYYRQYWNVTMHITQIRGGWVKMYRTLN